jgi:RNA recognition motif-containing protein
VSEALAMDSQQEYEPGKLFVGGLSWETTEDGMRAHFEQFGVVEDCIVMREQDQPPNMKKNRGFGFVRFADPQDVEKVIQHPVHMLDSKKIDPKLAVLKGGGPIGIGAGHDKKVFLGGLLSSTTEQDIRDYFKAYFDRLQMYDVNVTDIDFKIDRNTNRMRGFGFVGFDSAAARDRVVQAKYHDICGKRVEAKPAEPRGAGGGMRQANPINAYTYQQAYTQGGDYRGASNGQQYPGQYYGGGGGQAYYNPYGGPPQAGYGQQYSSATNYSYDHTSQYPRTQTSTGDRQDTQSYYQQPYGHGGAQPLAASYGQDASSYTGRSAYATTQDSYGQQMASYGRSAAQQQPQQQQPHYGGGGASYGH